jgi:hypothetical protein
MPWDETAVFTFLKQEENANKAWKSLEQSSIAYGSKTIVPIESYGSCGIDIWG